MKTKASTSAQKIRTDRSERSRARAVSRQRVLDSLLSDIGSGRLRPGDRLPSDGELCKKFSASRTIVARAIRELKDRGLLHSLEGRASVVSVAAGITRRVALFAPFAQAVSGLGFMGAHVYAHLANLASQRGDHLSLQLIDRVQGDPLPRMLESANRLISMRVDGVFYYPVELPVDQFAGNQKVVDKLLSAGLAVVLVDRDVGAYPHRSQVPLVKYDNFRGGYLITDHIIKQGRKRIAYVGIPNVSSAASDRMRGHCDALDDHGLSDDRSLIRRAGLDELDNAFWQKLLEETQPDAVVCNSDRYAASLGRYLASINQKVGTDMLLAGFGDQPFAQMLSAPLTTVRFPLTPFSAACYDRLLSQIAHPGQQLNGQTIIDVELVVRESTSTGMTPRT